MTSIIQVQPATYQPITMSREFAEHLYRMELARQAAEHGMQEVSALYTYGEYKVINALAETELYRKVLEQSGAKLTPEEEEVFFTFRQQYIEAMARIVEHTAARITLGVDITPRILQQRSFLDRVFGE